MTEYELTDYKIHFRGYNLHVSDATMKHIFESITQDQIAKLQAYYRDMTDRSVKVKLLQLLARVHNLTAQGKNIDYFKEADGFLSLVMGSIVEKVKGIENPHNRFEHEDEERIGFNDAIQAVIKSMEATDD